MDFTSRLERRQKIRQFVRTIVAEHNFLKQVGVSDDVSLFRLSAACSKPDVVKAQERARGGSVVVVVASC